MTYTVFHETSEVRSHSVVTRMVMTLKELVFLKCIYMGFFQESTPSFLIIHSCEQRLLGAYLNILGQNSFYTWNSFYCHGICGRYDNLLNFTNFRRVSICLLNRLLKTTHDPRAV